MGATDTDFGTVSGIGLALSGGGYRATLFHLGSLRRLAELGVLDRVTHFSSVSGGSISAGALAADWVAHPTSLARDRVQRITALLQEFCSHTIDTGTIIGGALTPFRRVSDFLADKYDGALFHGVTLSALPVAGPQFTFCATNLQTGRLVHLTSDKVVDYRIGTTDLDVPLARAVAASSAFPPFLSPVEIDCKNATWTPTHYSTLTSDAHYNKRLYLTDGGAYDNMGLEPLWRDGLTVLVSDAGAPYVSLPSIHTDWFTQLHAVFDIATDQARGVRKRWLIDQFQHQVAQGTYWGIATQIANYGLADPMPVSPAVSAALAAMRTRLNAFAADEQAKLINWGYAVCDAAMRRWCSTLCPTPPPPVLPYPTYPLH